jgi:hypothetical protein
MNRKLLPTTAVLLAIVLPATSAAAASKHKAKPKKHVRTVTLPYDHPCGPSLQTSAVYGPTVTTCSGSYQVSTAADEKFMSIAITDTTGQSVPVTFIEDGTSDAWQVVCGKMEGTPVIPSDTYDLMPMVAIGNICPAPATQGTITVKISNYPL